MSLAGRETRTHARVGIAIAALAAATSPRPAEGQFCTDYGLACTLEAEPAAPSLAVPRCPNDADDPPSVPNRCVNWANPQHCVGYDPNFPCPNNYTTIQAAVDAVTTSGETILVRNWPWICDPSPCAPPIYPQTAPALSVNKRVCLKAQVEDFWLNPADWRYPATIQSAPGSAYAVLFGINGSGSCVQGFKIDHRGTGAAVVIGTSAPVAHANDVTFVNNTVDVSQSAGSPHGISIAGSGNRVHRNVIVGAQRAVAAGVIHRLEHFDTSTCAEWDGNQINGNFITSFENGVEYRRVPAIAPACDWTGNRIDFNDIRDCNTGIRASTGGQPLRLIIMENSVAAGRNYAGPPPPCASTPLSNGIWIADSNQSNVISNRVSGVGIGIHLDYHACWTRVKKNQVSTIAGDDLARGIWVCPTHCNFLVENEITTTSQLTGCGIDFSNAAVCFPFKTQGSHTLDGGLIHTVRCVTRQRSNPTLTLGTLPGRARFAAIDCP